MPRYKQADFIEGMKGSMGIKSIICKNVGCDFKTLQKWLEKHAKLRDAFENERQKLVGAAEGGLVKLISQGDYRAIQFALTHLAKDQYQPPAVNVKVTDWRKHLPAGVSIEDAESAQMQFAAMLQGAKQEAE